jgi:hypothetical protein
MAIPRQVGAAENKQAGGADADFGEGGEQIEFGTPAIPWMAAE